MEGRECEEVCCILQDWKAGGFEELSFQRPSEYEIKRIKDVQIKYNQIYDKRITYKPN